MDHPVVADELCRDARLLEPARICLSLVAERVEPGSRDERGRKTGQVRLAERRRVVIRAVALSEIVVPVPAHAFLREAVPLGELCVRASIEVVVGYWVDEQLKGERDAGIACAP